MKSLTGTPCTLVLVQLMASALTFSVLEGPKQDCSPKRRSLGCCSRSAQRTRARQPAGLPTFPPNFVRVSYNTTAFDLAVTVPPRQECLAHAGQVVLAAASSYSLVKSAHRDTARVCQAQGREVPADGAQGPERPMPPRCCCRSPVRLRSGQTRTHQPQELSVMVRSHRARAVLRRKAA